MLETLGEVKDDLVLSGVNKWTLLEWFLCSSGDSRAVESCDFRTGGGTTESEVVTLELVDIEPIYVGSTEQILEL